MKKLFISATLFLLFSGSYAHAQTQPTTLPTQTASQFCTGGSCTYVPLEPLPLLPNCFGPACASLQKTDGSFAGLISGSFKLLIGGGAVIAVVLIVLGALTYMFSDIAGNKKKALDRIRGSVWAIVLLLSSYLILVTINPDLVKFNLTLGTGGAAPTATPSDGSTRIIIQNSGSTVIYDGKNAYDQKMNQDELCTSQSQGKKALHATSNGSDATGSYTLWTCE